MNLIFTLCSNNYLAQAKTLGDSLTKHNPGYKFIVGLVDEFDEEVDYSFFEPYTIIPVAKIGIDNFDDLWKKYAIVEFNTCVKASYFKYIFKAYPGVNAVCYLDPDIVVYYSLKILEDAFIDNDLLLTPHIMSPIGLDDKQPGENVFLNHGLYNLGFLGVHRNCAKANGFLDWWEHRTLTIGFDDTSKGLFVDQLWINFIPLFYDRVRILRNLGLNMAPWNLHERALALNKNENCIMTDGSPLYFYHFSSYRYNSPNRMSKYYNRYSFDTHPELKKIYTGYHQSLLSNKIEELSQIKCVYVERRKEYLRSKASAPSRSEELISKIKSGIKLFIPPVLLKIKNSII